MHNPMTCNICWFKFYLSTMSFVGLSWCIISEFVYNYQHKNDPKARMTVKYEGDNTRVIYELEEINVRQLKT